MTSDSNQKNQDYLSLVGAPRSLFDKLDAIHNRWYLDGKVNRPKSDDILRHLNNDHGINVISIAIQAMQQGSSPFDIMDVLNPVLPSLVFKPSDVIALWRELYDRTTNDMASGRQYDGLSNLLTAKPNIAGEFLSLLSQTNEPFVVGYISEAHLALADKGFQTTFDELMILSESENEFEVIASINALGRLKYSRKNKSLITRVLKRYENLETNASNKVLYALVQSHGQLLTQRASISKKLIKFLAYDMPEIDYALSKILFLNRGQWEDENWYREIFQTLSRTSTANRGIIGNLDYIAHGYMKTDTGKQIVESFLLAWIEESDYSKKTARFEKLFNSVAHDYLRQRQSFEKFVTNLFNSDVVSAHQVASELIAYNSLHKRLPLELCVGSIKSFSQTDLVYVSRKVIANVYQCEEAASLIYSMLNKNPRDKAIQSLVYEVLADIIGFNYVSSTIKFLEKKKQLTKAKSRIELCDKIIAKLELDIQKLDALPILKECYVSSNRAYIAQLAHQKVMRKSMDEASDGSLASMFTKVSLKYGRGSFFTVNDQISSPTPMVTHSTSMELPRSEISHPVYAAMERLNYKLCKRGQ